MPHISTLFSGILFLVALVLTMTKVEIWSKVPQQEKLQTLGVLVFFFVMLATGAWYALRRNKIAGWVHTALLIAVAIYGIKTGGSMLGDRSIMGGRGPDANPAAGIVYLMGALAAGIGGVAGICAISLTIRLRSSEKHSPDS